MREWPVLKAPDECLKEPWKRVPGYIRLTFASALVLGLVTHLYAFTNKFTNTDDLDQMLRADYGTASGRWLLPPLLKLDGPFGIPWLIGLLSVLCLAGVACFTVSVLRIRRPVWCVLTAALLVTFPTVTATFAYMFSADAYFFALLLAAFGAWAAVRYGWWGSALCAAALTLSMGVYQAYFPVAAVLMVGALLLETLDGDRSFRELLLRGLRLVGTLAVSLAAYLAVVKITTRDTGLVDYHGLSQIGTLSLGELPEMLFKTVGKYYTFYFENDTGSHFGFLKYLFVLSCLASLALGVVVLVRRRLGALRTVLALVLVLLYPLAGDIIYVMVNNSFVHELMIYGLCYILLLPIAMVEYAWPVLEEEKDRTAHIAVSWLVCLTMALTSWSYMVAANSAYFKMDLSLRQCEAYSNRLLARIEACEGYEPGMDVVLSGCSVVEPELIPTPELDAIHMTGVYDLDDFRTCHHYPLFLRYFLASTTGEVYVYEGLYVNEPQMAEILTMPVYPRAGSIRVIDGFVAVRLN